MVPAGIDTPALLLDRDRVERNIERMRRFFDGKPASLRPHFKTPKCPEVARLQLAAGAIGITCAKLGEVEALVEGGVRTSVLVANQIVGRPKLDRLVALVPKLSELIVAVDHPAQIDALDARVRDSGVTLGALIEVDTGMHRCGSNDPELTVELARRLDSSRIAYRGVMGYEGHAVLIEEDDKRRAAAEDAVAALAAHVSTLDRVGLTPEIVSGGGTGTHDITGSAPRVTEIQAGSYVFMDGTYRKVRPEFECALTLATTVVHRRGRLLITDCGMKSLSHDMGLPEGADLPLRCVALSEEHAFVVMDEGADLDLAVGDPVELLPSHGDTTINLHDRYLVRRGAEVEAEWPITARGRFR